ncbi:unnamed protein product, partial [Rotaria magnacalcarata]
RSLNQHDLIVVERVPFQELANGDFLYREQYAQEQEQEQEQEQQKRRYQSDRQIRRRYSSIVDERRAPFHEKAP